MICGKDKNMYEIVKNKVITCSVRNKSIENKVFKNCVFKNIEENLNIKNTLFIDCVFEKCKLSTFISEVEAYGCEIYDLRLFRTNICNLKIKKCLTSKLRIADSFMSNVGFKENYMEALNITNTFALNSSFISNKFSSMHIYFSSFYDSSIESCEFKNPLSTIRKTYFDSCCLFENVDFLMIEKENNNYSKNTILGKFKNCKNKDRLDLISPCPAEGSFIGYKKCWYDIDSYRVEDCIVTLKICEDAKRLGQSDFGKCRCSKAEVVKIETMDGEPIQYKKVYSMYDRSFLYEVGKIVKPKNGFDENEEKECSRGIHFFMTKREAKNYL